MVDSRNKGAQFELKICKRINEFLQDRLSSVRVKRNLEQYQVSNQCDIDLPNYSIECKAYKDGCWYQEAWWIQCVDSCRDKTPVLIFKFNNKPIRAVVPLYFVNPSLEKDNYRTVVMTLEEWFNCLDLDEELYFPQLEEIA